MFYADGIHDDTAALQELLDKRGIVTIEKNGTYLVSRTLIIHSDTRLILAPGVRLKAADNSRCALIENEHFRLGLGRDRNIEIFGGAFDGNSNGQGLDGVYEAEHREDLPYSTELFKGKLIRFAHIDNISLEKMTVCDPVSYGVQIADVRGFVVRDIHFDYNCCFGTTDGIHINGPARDGIIENLYGITNDDMVSLTTIDETHAEVTVGEISNVYIHNISAENGFSGIRLLSAGGFEMRNIHINGVYGTYRHNAVLVSHHYTRPGTPTWFDDIIIEQVHAHKSPYSLREDQFTYWDGYNRYLPLVWFGEGANCGRVTLRDISRYETTDTDGALVQLDEDISIERLYAENITQTLAEGITAPMWVNNGKIGQLIMKDVK
ncbi:MAG: hypothetical protein J6B93_06035 [Clostridia bacterium]|nr:hypothetical protein [Clostridia bacterium]